jgi:hypothetical protein
MSVTEEVIVPFPVPRGELRPAASVRSTLIVSSLRSIRDHGRERDYLANLAHPWRDLPSTSAGVWLPLDAAFAHYRACQALGFSAQEQVAIGREVGDRLHGTFLGTMVRAARGAGADPWIALTYSRRFHERVFDGGGLCVTKIGPKDARVEVAGNPLWSIPYLRNATRGLWQVGIELFCTRTYGVELSHDATSFKMRFSWA